MFCRFYRFIRICSIQNVVYFQKINTEEFVYVWSICVATQLNQVEQDQMDQVKSKSHL